LWTGARGTLHFVCGAGLSFQRQGMSGVFYENRRRARKPRVSVFIAVVIVCVAVVIVLKKGRTATMDIPKVAASSLSHRGKAAIDQARRELEADESADRWGRYGMVLHAFDFDAEALRCFQTALSLDSRNPRWPYFIRRISRAKEDVPINEQFENEVAAIRGEARE
jgi:hypothetical protein